MGRPKASAADKKAESVYARMSAAERDVFDRLKASREAEGVEVSDGGLVRWLVMKEAAARGIVPAPKPAKPTRRG